MKGGYGNWKIWGETHLQFGSVGDLCGYTCVCDLDYYKNFETHHILEILLDPKGLKAAYLRPESLCDNPKCGNNAFGGSHQHHGYSPDTIAHRILDSWLSGGAEAAIKTAYDLLPKKP